jgi:hypothetical protein
MKFQLNSSLPQKVQLLETVNKYLLVLGEERFTLHHHQNTDDEEWFNIFNSSNSHVDDRTFDEVLNYWEENF